MAEVLSAIGLAYRAGKVVLGEEVLKRIREVRLLFLAADLSKKSRERFEKKCNSFNIRHIDVFSGEELSKALGRNNVKVIGVLDEGFKELLIRKMEKEGCNGKADIQKASEQKAARQQ